MSKKLITPDFNKEIITPESMESKWEMPPKIVNVKPVGSQILVEILTAQEMANTNIVISEKTDLKVPMQGYVRAVGPGFKADAWGYDVGNRVLISGSGVMAPSYDKTHRDRFFMEPTAVKSVLVEE